MRRPKRHSQKPPIFVCSHCQAGKCEECVDVLRVVFALDTLCECTRKGHSGEPVDQQVADPFTGAVHAPDLVVTADGDVERDVANAPCPVCKTPGMVRQHGEAGHCLPNVPGGYDQRTEPTPHG
jgi:hypothetical protein